MSCIVSRLLTDVTPARLRQLPFTGRRGQGVRRGLRTAPVGSPSCPPGTYKTEHSACTCIRMVFRTFIRIRICIRVRLGTFRDRQLLDIDIAAVHSPPNTARGRPRRPSYPTRQAVCTRIKSRQQSLWMTTVHRSVIIVTYATIAARTYTTKDAGAGCPVAMTGTKN